MKIEFSSKLKAGLERRRLATRTQSFAGACDRCSNAGYLAGWRILTNWRFFIRTDTRLHEQQRAVCRRFHPQFSSCGMHLKLGVSLNVKSGIRPLNGMRINADSGTNGLVHLGERNVFARSRLFIPLHGEHRKQ